jgi:hypothetical protein
MREIGPLRIILKLAETLKIRGGKMGIMDLFATARFSASSYTDFLI